MRFSPSFDIIKATKDPSNLLAHEAAFVLGQMQDAEAIPALKIVLNDYSLHPIVRHEAAEALGAIGLESNITLLKDSLESDPAQEVRETCELALSRLEELKNVDPAGPASCSSIGYEHVAMDLVRQAGEQEPPPPL
ncbi:deoxyhypusine hydroxylase [Tanacetum coccineum]